MSDFENERIADESEHPRREGSFENVTIEYNRNKWRISGILGFTGWTSATTFFVTHIEPIHIEDAEDHESFEVALDLWMQCEGIDIETTAVRIGEWIKQ